MTIQRHALPAILVLSAALLAGCAGTAPKAEWDGLVRQPGTRLDAVFVRPDTEGEIAAFRSVMLDPVSVSFARDFDPNRGTRSVTRRVNADDLIAIQESLATLFREVFREELAAGGYELVETPGRTRSASPRPSWTCSSTRRIPQWARRVPTRRAPGA
jgi:hypothetical protein